MSLRERKIVALLWRHKAQILWPFAFVLFLTIQFSVARNGSQVLPLKLHTLTVLAVNIPLIACATLLLVSVFNRIWIAGFAAVCVTAALCAGNLVKRELLGDALDPARDIPRIRDAAPYLGPIFMSREVLWGVGALLCLAILAVYLELASPRLTWKRSSRILAGAFSLLALALPPVLAPVLPRLHLLAGRQETDWTGSCAADGVPLSFLERLHDGFIHPAAPATPEGYGPGRIQAICDRILEGYKPVSSPHPAPDVVLIAAEALMDPSRLPNISHPVDWLASVHALQQQAGPYRLVSPVIGGMSINADFEILTGFSTRYDGVENGSASDVLYRHVPNIGTVLKSRGYETFAVYATPRTLFRHEWLVKNAFVFDHAVFEEDLGGHLGLMPDSVAADRILQDLDAPSAKPRFVYAQFERNHFPWADKNYQYPNVVPSSPLGGEDAQSFSEYIEGVYVVDHVLGDLAAALKRRAKPVVLIVYGDHLPALGEDELRAIGVAAGARPNSLAERLAMHQTPGLIWAWGGPPAARPGDLVGMNYLAGYILQSAGISHPFYTDFLLRLHEQLPVLDDNLICMPGGRPVAAIPQEDQPLAADYKLLEYDMLFGRRYALRSLFPELK